MWNAATVRPVGVQPEKKSLPIKQGRAIVNGFSQVRLSADAATAQAENFAGLYARVAIVIDINGVSGLFVVQPTINDDGTIVIPSITMPGLTVKGVSVALVPTLADIQKSMPEVKASDMRMLG